MNLDEGTRISVRSDSQAAIQAITGRTVSSKTVNECQTVLASVKETMQVRIDWIKGHVDHPGNEAADALAKEANKLARDLHGPTTSSSYSPRGSKTANKELALETVAEPLARV